MATLLENLTSSLTQTRQRMASLKEKGISSMREIYPDVPCNPELYYQLLETLPDEISRLEKRIRQLNNKF